MSAVIDLIATLSDEDLKEAVRHLRAFDDADTEVPAQSALRRLVEHMERDRCMDGATALAVARIGLMRAAAYKWIDEHARPGDAPPQSHDR